MTLNNLLAALGKLRITLMVMDGKIAAPPDVLTDELRQAIIAHKSELIARLQAEQVPVAAPTAIERKIPSLIRLQYALDWFDSKTRKIPMANHGRQKARLTLPTACRWLISWLSKAQRLELEDKGFLPWGDWNAVIGEVRGRFEGDLAL